MSDRTTAEKPPLGHYLGTSIGEKWYRRYRKDGFLARGLGRYWCQDGELHFRRFFLKTPIIIPLRSVTEVLRTAWHAGRWAGTRRIIVLVWQKDGEELRSGFVFSRSERAIQAAIAWIEEEIAAAKGPTG